MLFFTNNWKNSRRTRDGVIGRNDTSKSRTIKGKETKKIEIKQVPRNLKILKMKKTISNLHRKYNLKIIQ